MQPKSNVRRHQRGLVLTLWRVAAASLLLAVAPASAPAAEPAKQAAPAVPVDAKTVSDVLGATLTQNAQGQVLVVKIRKTGTAHRAGMRPGDQIEMIDDQKIASIDDVVKALNQQRRGKALRFSIKPSQGLRHLTVVPAKTHPPAANAVGRPMIGVVLADEAGHAIVSQLYAGGPAEQAGIRTGDRIEAIDGKKVASKRQCVEILDRHKPGDQVDVLIGRNSWRRDFSVKLAAGQTVAKLPTTATQPPAAAATATYSDDDWMDDQQYNDLRDPALRAVDTDFDG